MDRPDLLQALDQAIAAVLRLEATGLRTAQGGSASGELERLRAELAAVGPRWRPAPRSIVTGRGAPSGG